MCDYSNSFSDCPGSTNPIEFHNVDPMAAFGETIAEGITDTITVSGIINIVEDVEIDMQIGTTFSADLEIDLAYDGTSIIIFADEGSSGDNVDVTIRCKRIYIFI